MGSVCVIFDPHGALNLAEGPHMHIKPKVYYLKVESAKKLSSIINSVHFFLLWSFLAIWAPWSLLEAFVGPCCVLPVPIWIWVPKCAILRDQWARKMLIYNNCPIFCVFASLEKSFSESAMGF